jgi:hypothetical protein
LKFLKRKSLHISAVCLAATVSFATPMNASAIPIIVTDPPADKANVAPHNVFSQQIWVKKYYLDANNYPETYYYDDGFGWTGTLTISDRNPAPGGNDGIWITYSGYINCHGAGCNTQE